MSRHAIEAMYSTDDDGLAMNACITMDADTSNREECCEVLPRDIALTFRCCSPEIFLNDVTRFPAGCNSITRQITEDSNCQSWPWKWLPL